VNLDLDLTPTLTVDVPGPIASAANLREHHAQKSARVKSQRDCADAVTLAALRTQRPSLSLPLVVVLTRLAPRRLDTDNLAHATKAHRDGVTKALARYLKDAKQPAPSDDSDRLRWLYDQVPARGGEEALRVSIYPSGAVAQWLLRHLPVERSSLERWVIANAPRLDALIVKGGA
jgi:hypothetical protein